MLSDISVFSFNGQLEEFRFLKDIIKIKEDKSNFLSSLPFFTNTKRSTETSTEDIEEQLIKQNPLNHVVSVFFLDKLAELYQFPFVAIDNIVSFISEHCNLPSRIDYIKGEKPKLKIEGIGKGLPVKEFLRCTTEFKVFGDSNTTYLTPSLFRLGDTVLIINKEEELVSLVFFSRTFTSRPYGEFMILPVTVCKKEKQLIPIGEHSKTGLSIILSEAVELFNSEEEMTEYLLKDEVGIEFLVSEIRINALNQPELTFDSDNRDIIFNPEGVFTGQSELIDYSLHAFLSLSSLKRQFSLHLNNIPVKLNSPLTALNRFIEDLDCFKASNLKITSKGSVQILQIKGELYDGILFKRSAIEQVSSLTQDKLIHNGILIYNDGKLLFRLGQNKIGDTKFLEKNKVMHISGYIDVKGTQFKLSPNKVEFADQTYMTLLKERIHRLVKKLIK